MGNAVVKVDIEKIQTESKTERFSGDTYDTDLFPNYMWYTIAYCESYGTLCLYDKHSCMLCGYDMNKIKRVFIKFYAEYDNSDNIYYITITNVELFDKDFRMNVLELLRKKLKVYKSGDKLYFSKND